MTEKEILKQLHDLRFVEADSTWKNECRNTLLNQISAGRNENVKKPFMTEVFYISRRYLSWASQPVGALLLAFFIIFGGAAVSWKVSESAKPGDSLYIAKVLSEKTRATFAFSEKKKTELSVEFASNRVKEISQVLTESAEAEAEKADKVEKLSQDFKTEINNVKLSLGKIASAVKIARQPAGENSGSAGADQAISESAASEEKVFSADTGKENQGIEISETGSEPAGKAEAKGTTTGSSGGDLPLAAENSTTTQEMLEEAEKLFESKDYDGTILKLEEVKNIISGDEVPADNQGEVKGEAEAGTSTEAGAGK